TGGRDGLHDKSEHPNHFADMDKVDSHGQNLLEICQDHDNVDPARWMAYYNDPQVKEDLHHMGLLPFRVAQFFKIMVKAAKEGDAPTFLAAAGIVSHYVGDSCQPLHISFLHDGDPANTITRTVHHRNGTTSEETEPVAMGVHSDYEDKMIDQNTDEILLTLQASVQPRHDPFLKTPHDAAVATVELMRRTFNTLAPRTIVDKYTAEIAAGTKKKSQKMASALWVAFKEPTLKVLTDGGVTLAHLWDSAWHEASMELGSEPNVSGVVGPELLMGLYRNPAFAPSCTIDKIHNEI
ncbi:MAG: hypothetical protein ABUL49_01745, partial [bacterium]